MVRQLIPIAAAFVFLSWLPGCGSDTGPQTVPVSGTISLDDKPLPDVQVNFFSEGQDFISTGVTDPDGRYQLYAGAVPGENKVWVTKMPSGSAPAGDPAENPELDPAQTEAASEAEMPGLAAGDDQLPAKFSDPNKTVLKFMVPEGGTDSAGFTLTSR